MSATRTTPKAVTGSPPSFNLAPEAHRVAGATSATMLRARFVRSCSVRAPACPTPIPAPVAATSPARARRFRRRSE
jgi:hypothetical protein